MAWSIAKPDSCHPEGTDFRAARIWSFYILLGSELGWQVRLKCVPYVICLSFGVHSTTFPGFLWAVFMAGCNVWNNRSRARICCPAKNPQPVPGFPLRFDLCSEYGAVFVLPRSAGKIIHLPPSSKRFAAPLQSPFATDLAQPLLASAINLVPTAGRKHRSDNGAPDRTDRRKYPHGVTAGEPKAA